MIFASLRLLTRQRRSFCRFVAEMAAQIELAKEKRGRKRHWLAVDIVVKVLNKTVGDGAYYKKKGVVRRLVDRFTGEVEMLDGGDVLRLDQADCETVRASRRRRSSSSDERVAGAAVARRRGTIRQRRALRRARPAAVDRHGQVLRQRQTRCVLLFFLCRKLNVVALIALFDFDADDDRSSRRRDRQCRLRRRLQSSH